MVNYPYPTNFLANLPGYPIREACKPLTNSSLSGKALLTALKNGLSVYTNYTGSTKCLDIGESTSSSIGELGWDFQVRNLNSNSARYVYFFCNRLALKW